MYDVALSVLSCLRARTDVHVAWVVSPATGHPTEAVAVTPGGGRMGNLLDGALDHSIREAVRDLGDGGRLIEIQMGPAEAIMSGLPPGTTINLAILAGSSLPIDVWEDLAAHRPTRFSLQVAGTELIEPEHLEPGDPGIELTDDLLVTSYVPVTRALIAGGGRIAAALADAFGFVGWQALVHDDVGTATGVMATLSAIDAVVVLGHDVEVTGRALQGAIASRAGYIASVGSQRMQQLRRDWLAYRDVDWDDRVRGPAGLDIGASSPPEIAVSIVAEALSARQ